MALLLVTVLPYRVCQRLGPTGEPSSSGKEAYILGKSSRVKLMLGEKGRGRE